MKSWLGDFLSSCLRRLKIPKIWRRALVVAIPKPGKPVGDPKSYRPISLLCVPYKILERLIYARVEPLIDPLLPKEQAGFRREKSTVDQVVLLTQNIEDSFEAKKKAGAVFIDLTAAYDTVWHRGLTCKLLRLLPDKHTVKMIMELVRNRSFTLTTGDSKLGQVRLRSRRPFVPAARNLLNNLARLGIRASEWTNHKWKTEYSENASRLRAFVPRTGARPVGMGLPRAALVKLNRLWTGVGRFHSSMHKWGLAPSPNCECGASEQTADHVLTACPIHRAPHGARGLTVLDDETRCWLNNITASI